MPAHVTLVRAADEHRFEARLHLAEASGAPMLVFGPAMGTRARFYDRFGQALATAGVSFCSWDWRGMASSSERASRRRNWGYQTLVTRDFPAVVDVARQAAPQASALWMGGHSLGGQLATLFAARNPGSSAGLLLIAAGSVHFRGWSGLARLKILGLTQSAVALSELFGHFPGTRLGFGGREARGVIRDWARCARNGLYAPDGSDLDYEAALAELQQPVHAWGFAADTLAPSGSTRRLLDKLRSSPAEHYLLHAGDTGGEALDHFSWARAPQHIVPPVLECIRPLAAGSR